jgi:hypothetical protein
MESLPENPLEVIHATVTVAELLFEYLDSLP